MKSHRRLRAKKIGLPPGTLMHVGEIKSQHIEMALFRYNAETLTESVGLRVTFSSSTSQLSPICSSTTK